MRSKPAALDLPEGPKPPPGETVSHRRPPVRARFLLLIVVGMICLSTVAAVVAVQRPPTAVMVDTPPGTAWTQETAAVVMPSVGIVSVGSVSSGTAFFYAKDRMLTAAHVVSVDPAVVTAAEAGRKPDVAVTLSGGQQFTAHVLTIDSSSDIAVLQAPQPEGIPVLPFDERLPQPGRPVMTVGGSFGDQVVVGDGIISGVLTASRFSSGSAQTVLLSTTSPTNPGMSGGPLVSADGSVLGVIVARPDTVNGRPAAQTSVAVPSALMTGWLGSVRAGSEVKHRHVGISGRFDVSAGPGIVVNAVAAGSTADKAGIRANDVITGINGQPVTTAADLAVAVAQGDAVTVTVVTGQAQPSTVTLNP